MMPRRTPRRDAWGGGGCSIAPGNRQRAGGGAHEKTRGVPSRRERIGGGAAGRARRASRRPDGAGAPRSAFAEDHRREGDRHGAGGAAARGRQDHDRPGRALRLRLRHVHAARRPRGPGCRALPEAVPGRQAGGPDRGHLAGALRELVLAQRPGAQQRDQRRRHGALGHQGPAGRAARLPASRRQGPRGRGLLRARERLRDPRGDRERSRAHGSRLPARARPGRRAGHGGLRLARRRHGAGPGAARGARLRARGLRAPCAAAAGDGAQGARRRGRAAARRARARHAHAGAPALQGRRALPDVLRRGPALARGHRLVPADPAAVHDALRRWASSSTARTSGSR